ncbi:right-handed parallel beta-helix repeat-containing protein [Paenibacillus mesophilus]|uniref:right-handed parallel beta-helix repeat-containing protein n=1 Tax=Paenibacillus mesophilus TaxID=2582849 RepID=UPI00130531B5|nr:right-handed parallel beta-helix repeat-containing protein [Paenibacillus mesophilus]
MMSRRKLLASIGMAGAAAAAGDLLLAGRTGSVYAGVVGSVYGTGGAGCCETTTIAGLRANTTADPDTLYFVGDAGQEGWFRYDPSDTASADNTGTVLVSTAGYRFKRILELSQGYDVKWFGAKGDGGTDDTAAIQAAIDAAYSNGAGLVYIPARGTFRFRSIRVKGNMTFASFGGTLKLLDNVCVSTSASYYLIHNMVSTGGSYPNVTLDGLIIDGNRSGGNTSFAVADGITIGGENAVVRNCRLFNIPDSGIMFSKATNSVCTMNRIDDGGDVGIYVNDGSGTSHYENVISHNRITGFPYGGIALKRICQRTIVSDNSIYNCGNGITLEHASTSSDFSRNVSILGNRLRYIGYMGPATAKVGIILRVSDYSIVADNRLEDIAARGILLEGSQYCSVSGNVIEMKPTADAALNHGIELRPRGTAGCGSNTIRGNVIVAPRKHGLYVTPQSVPTAYNIVTGNVVRSAGDTALKLEAASNDNVFSDNILEGAVADLACDTAALRNSYSNNRLVNGTITGAADQSNGAAYSHVKDKRRSIGAAAPTSGAWVQGDIVYADAPSAGGTIGWVCTAGGTPGTWKPFGDIGL